jgi:hypothetical protein
MLRFKQNIIRQQFENIQSNPVPVEQRKENERRMIQSEMQSKRLGGRRAQPGPNPWYQYGLYSGGSTSSRDQTSEIRAPTQKTASNHSKAIHSKFTKSRAKSQVRNADLFNIDEDF